MLESSKKRAFALIRNLLTHALAQTVTMLLSFLTGILLVRSMSKEDYGYYSIAVSFTAAIVLVADAGVAATIMSRLGGSNDRSTRISGFLTTAITYRRRVSLPIILIGTTLVGLLLFTAGQPSQITLACGVILICSLYFMSLTSLYQALHRIQYNFKLLRNIALLQASLRFIVILVITLSFQVNVIVALLVTLFTSAIANWIFSRYLKSARNGAALVDELETFKMNARRTLPMTVLLVVSEQAVIVILTFLGSPEIIAEVSALARFGVIFTILNLAMNDIAAPIIARMVESKIAIVTRIAVSLTAYATIGGLVTLAAWLAAPLLLSLLGAQYEGLERALMTVMIGQFILNFSYAFGFLNQARGWLKLSWTYALFILVWAVCCLSLLDVTTTEGAALLMASHSVPTLAVQFVRFLAGVQELPSSPKPKASG